MAVGVAVLLGLAVVLGLVRALAPVPGGEPLSYREFEEHVREGKVEDAEMDGNIVRFTYREGGESAWVAVPDPGRAAGLMMEHGVDLRARRPVPASGLSGPVLLAVLLPYLFLGGIVLMMVRAVEGAAGFPLEDLEPRNPGAETGVVDQEEAADATTQDLASDAAGADGRGMGL